jgi:hypothetical protein
MSSAQDSLETPLAASRIPARVPALLFGFTIAIGAFLLFQVQPLIAKLILPWFGGSAGVWTSCMLFFQFALLGGYTYAHWLSEQPGRRQTAIHLALLAVSLLSLPILPSVWWKPQGAGDPLLRILGLLAATVGLPYFLLSSTSPLLQSWYSRSTGGAMPYRFFALSNAGSMAGLLTYPILVEPYLTNRVQAWMWSVSYAVFGVICATVAFRSRGIQSERYAASRSAGASAPRLSERLLWMGLAACASALMLAVTNHLTQNIAPIPFLWVLPLSLYLLSFILCFDSDRWYRRRLFAGLAALAIPAMAWMLDEGGYIELRMSVSLFCVMIFVLFMVCHGELARRRPAPAFVTSFYLMVSLGGAAGGLLVGFAAPYLFNALYDLPVVLSLICFLFAWLLWCERRPMIGVDSDADSDAAGASVQRTDKRAISLWSALLLGYAIFRLAAAARFHAPKLLQSMYDAPVLFGLAGMIGAYLIWRGRSLVDARFLRFTLAVGVAAGVICYLARGSFASVRDARVLARNFYGALKVFDSETDGMQGPVHTLRHGTIDHGEQFLWPRNSHRPTTYFTGPSGIGLAVHRVQQDGPMRMGIVGLGAGTLATYARPGDHYRFYDINPLVMRIAATQFTFLRDCYAPHEVVLGDARLMLEKEEPRHFDLLVVDAFSGDAIPVHLLTREAWALYWRHLNPDGVLAVHVSNRYLNLGPVVALGAEANGKRAMMVGYEGGDLDEEADSDWVLVTSRPGFFEQPEIKKAAKAIQPIAALRPWTDDYSNIYRILR